MSRNGSNGSKDGVTVFEANMDAAERSHALRTRAGIMDEFAPMPFDRIMDANLLTLQKALFAEDDGISGGDGGVGDYEMRQRVIGARALMRFIKGRGVTLPRILQQLCAAGRAVHDPYFASLTFTELGLMFSNTRAAHSFRCKLISGEIELGGMKGMRLPGQKSPESSEIYAKCAKGNKHRAKKVRQSSFLKRLKIKKKKLTTNGH